MTASIYLQINMIPFLALLIMRINAQAYLSYTWRNRALRFSMILLMAILATNGIAWYENGREGNLARFILWTANFAYCVLMEFGAYLWALYVYDVVSNGVGQRGKRVLPPAIPLLLFCAVLLVTPIKPLIFYIDENNCYVRGPLYGLHSLVAGAYYVAAAFMVIRAYRREKNREKRVQYRWMGNAIALPLLGGILQLFFYGIDVIWPFTTVSLMMVYIHVQQEQVTRDELTGLNNRRRLDQYMQEMEVQSGGDHSCSVILIDVDRFKKINDTYGHIVGDQVLKMVAEQMKRVFGNLRAFIARYGGDEFVIITRDIEEPVREEALAQLREAVSSLRWGDADAWQITLSIGIASCCEGINEADGLMQLADKRMYEEKRLHHMER